MASFYDRAEQGGRTVILAVVACLVVTSFTAQLLLDAVYIFTTGVERGAAAAVAGLSLVPAVGLTCYFVESSRSRPTRLPVAASSGVTCA